jgi:hypothetical protein
MTPTEVLNEAYECGSHKFNETYCLYRSTAFFSYLGTTKDIWSLFHKAEDWPSIFLLLNRDSMSISAVYDETDAMICYLCGV